MNLEQINQLTPGLYDAGQRVLQIYSFADTDAGHAGKLLDWMAPPQGARVIDLGCGVGEVARLMQETRPDLNFTLVNLSDVQLGYCPPADICHANFLSVPRPSESYDCATFMFAIGHEDVGAGLREACRLLKEGGTLLVCDMERLAGDGADMARLVEYVVPTRDQFEAAARAAGFEVVECIAPEVARNVGPEVCGDSYGAIFGDVGPIVWKLRKRARLDRHTNIVLQLSGGKDSLVCLELLRPYLDRITVLWMNTGAAFPETVEQMARIRETVPHFVEINSDQPAQVAERGYPVDVLPVGSHTVVQHLTGQTRLPLQGFLECCMANLMGPMHQATAALGATLVIRGQKSADEFKGPLRTGDVVAGVEYWFPVEDWTDAEILAYADVRGVLPAHYADSETSLDCWSCTAYLKHNHGKLRYMRERHPAWGQEVDRRLIAIRQEIYKDMQHLEGAINGQ